VSEQIQLGLGERGDELDAKVLAALRSEVIEDRTKEILRVIAGHKGAASAIRSGEIAEQLGLIVGEDSRRIITRAVELFVMFFKIPIGASREKPFGYFLIVDAADLELAVRPLWGEVEAHLRRLRALTSKTVVARLYGQTMLKLDAEEKSKEAA
jgi:hypothetical protein